MAPSQGVVEAMGILGGGLLALMLIPQLWVLARTRSAHDLSHSFMALFNVGLLLVCLYNIFMELWVFTVACFLQLAFGVALQLGKVWADAHQRRERARRRGGRLEHALSLRSGAKVDFREFAAGGAAPFPLLRPAPDHAAQHLLMDARLALPPLQQQQNGAAAEQPQGGAAEQQAPEPAAAAGGCAFDDVQELLQEALQGAGLLLRPALSASRKQLGGGPSGTGAGDEETQDGAGELTTFLPCWDGHVVAIYNAHTASLSVDWLAVTEDAMQGMTAAAEAFCGALQERFPGSRVAASSLGRLPAA